MSLPPYDVGNFCWVILIGVLGLKCLPLFVDAKLFDWGSKCLPPYMGIGLLDWGLKCLPPFVDVG